MRGNMDGVAQDQIQINSGGWNFIIPTSGGKNGKSWKTTNQLTNCFFNIALNHTVQI